MRSAVIWLEGVIGAGKTTLARHLADAFHWRAIEEIVDGNPYLDRFYADPARWAFAMQVHLLQLEWETYRLARDVMLRSLQPPSVMLYLEVSVDIAMDRIKQRGREAERGIEAGYLRELKRGYESMVREMEGHAHPWCRGVEVIRIPWDRPDLDAAERLVQKALSS
jgi:deoxyadenosine/deoxycytidine kinase